MSQRTTTLSSFLVHCICILIDGDKIRVLQVLVSGAPGHPCYLPPADPAPGGRRGQDEPVDAAKTTAEADAGVWRLLSPDTEEDDPVLDPAAAVGQGQPPAQQAGRHHRGEADAAARLQQQPSPAAVQPTLELDRNL